MKYEEIVAVTEKERKKLGLYAVGGFLLAYVLMNVYASLGLPFGMVANLAFIGICAAGVYRLYRHGLLSYIYRIEDGVLLFAVNGGKYDKILCEVEVANVKYIAKGNGESIEGAYMNAAKSTDKQKRYVCVFADAADKIFKLAFEPSETYLEKAKELGIEIK